MKIQNLKSLRDKLRARAAKAKKDLDGAVLVGYTAQYAIYVHENVEAKHEVGQAKFLEQPARELRPVLMKIVIEAVKAGRTILQGLLLAGLRLQRESQKLCPVDTGNLKNSAFTRIEGGNGSGITPTA